MEKAPEEQACLHGLLRTQTWHITPLGSRRNRLSSCDNKVHRSMIPKQKSQDKSRIFIRDIQGRSQTRGTCAKDELASTYMDSPKTLSGDVFEQYALRLRWAEHVASTGESINAYRVLVGRSEGKRPLGRPRRRWEDNIKMDLREVGYDDRDWINLPQDRDQWWALCEGGNEPSGSLKAISNVRDDLNVALQQRRIGRTCVRDAHLSRLPPHSPDLTQCDFFMWGFVKDHVYVPPLPTTLDDCALVS
ncbi:hypothetical protein ANN_15392 [Periplaneta americana]|uniref:Uncharacterized protein n=1 Tax=Periplaneta americana TaxID=6978 RepID=A0ABQ8SGA7_PERAM|nr:hypothetical protein ANN_15392 [Periplaneta americana]